MTTVDRRLSSSEEVSFKTCRLAHLFKYELGYAPTKTNRKLAVGIGFHNAMEVRYNEGSLNAQLAVIETWAEERLAELKANGHTAEEWAEWAKDKDLLAEMVKGYDEWHFEAKLDEGYSTVSVEEKHYIEIPGAATILPIKLDLLQRNDKTGRLRIVDFKTAASFSTDNTKYQLSEQNGNYQLGILSVYGERPTELVYREARKMAPKTNPRSKPPYFREIPVVLTKQELVQRTKDYIQISLEVTNPGRGIYPNPSACCGSWKNDFQAPCLKVCAGMSPEEAISTSTGYAQQNPNARYDDEE